MVPVVKVTASKPVYWGGRGHC